MTKKRNNFSKEFKEQAIKMVLEQGLSKSEVGNRLGIHHTSIGNWVRAFQAKGVNAFPGKGNLSGKDAEIHDLKKRLKQAEMERDFLKKTAIFFAKEKK